MEDECSSWNYDHSVDVHGGQDGLDPTTDIRFSVRRTQRDPLTRQIEESALIHQGLEKKVTFGANNKVEPIVCLNRKEECFVPRVRNYSIDS